MIFVRESSALNGSRFTPIREFMLLMAPFLHATLFKEAASFGPSTPPDISYCE